MPDTELYYLDNFTRAIDWIARRYDDLLDEGERAFIADFVAMPLVSRALLVRMLMRQGVHFRASKLQYTEIGCPIEAAGPLLARGWLHDDPTLSLSSLFTLSTRPQLLQLFQHCAANKSQRKRDWLTALAQRHPAPRLYSEWADSCHDDAIFEVRIAPLCERLRLIFFGNLYQDWSTFVLADLGIFQYEKVDFHDSARAFQQRADVDAYLTLQQHRDRLDEAAVLESAEAIEEVVAAMISFATDNAWIAQRRAKCLFRAGQACERAQYWDTALLAYGAADWPGARHRAMRVLERCGREAQALQMAIAAIGEPESEEEAQRVARLHTRLLKRVPRPTPVLRHAAAVFTQAATADGAALPLRQRAANATVPAGTTNTIPAASPVSITRGVLILPHATRSSDKQDGEGAHGVSVECRVREALRTADAPVFYVENTLLGGLFGLLCWDAIFAPLPGAFFHPFQRGPADLEAPDFVARRATLFDAAMAQLDDGRYRRTILAQWRTKFGLQSPFVHWGALRRDVVLLALRCIPAAHLKDCFRRLLADVRGNRTGLPDLIQFWPRTRHYEMIEVKGPGDRLQDNQIRWLNHFAAHAIPARVLDVRWEADVASAAAIDDAAHNVDVDADVCPGGNVLPIDAADTVSAGTASLALSQ